MDNHRTEEALQNRKRRKEQLNLKRGKKKGVCTVEETTKMEYRLARLKRKEILKEKRQAMKMQIKRTVAKNMAK